MNKVTLAGGTPETTSGSTVWGTWVFSDATDKLHVTENSTISAENVRIQNGAPIKVDAGKTANLRGTITDTTFGANRSLTKTRSGTLAILGTSTSTYTGPKVVDGGILSLNSSGSIKSTKRISIAAGATLDVSSGYSFTGFDGAIMGNGTVTGDMTLPSGAAIAPGNSIGTLPLEQL